MITRDTDSLRAKLVLLVDDNDTHQYALGKHLRGASFDVIYAQSGAETLKQATEHLPDVILLDIHLPDFDGFQACKELKANPNTKRIPVVFHSAVYDTGDARAFAEALGAISFLSYPIEPEHLITVLRGAISRAERDGPAH